VENARMKRECSQIISVEIMIGNRLDKSLPDGRHMICKEKSHGLFTFLIAGRRDLVLSLLSKPLFKAAFTVAMHFGLTSVFTKIFCYIIFIGIILRYDHHLAKGLEQYASKG